ncbi:MAG: NUDIX domain-containing protein [archaeon]|nr:MAG: NUDIX domain-containing protein [archaeon]
MEGIANAGVGIMIVRDGKFLLGKRHDDPEKADSALHGEGTWSMPGGKIDLGMSHVETAVKELEEETGLKVEPEDLEIFDVSSNIFGEAHFITIGFLCRKFLGEPEVMEPDEILEWRWFPVDKPPKPMFFPSEKMLKAYLNKA